MQYLEHLEWGLPAGDFVQSIVSRSQTSSAHTIPSAAATHRTRFGQGSPWHANRAAGEALTWRGRNFIEAFASLKNCELAQATMLDLPAGCCFALGGDCIPAQDAVERYHLICRASADASIRVGHDTATPQTGDIWRIDDRIRSALVYGGAEGGAHLVFALRRRDALGTVHGEAVEGFVSGPRISPSSDRCRAVD